MWLRHGRLDRSDRRIVPPGGRHRRRSFARLRRRGRLGHAAFQLASAAELPLPRASVDVVVSGLVFNFLPSPAAGLAEMKRVARPGATLGAYVWDYAGRMDLIRQFWDAAVAIDPAARALDEGVRFPLCAPDALRSAFEAAGLARVETTTIDVDTPFASFDDYWTPFLGGQAPAPGYCMSLSEEARAALRERLRASLPQRADGSIRLIARAWAVRGRKG